MTPRTLRASLLATTVIPAAVAVGLLATAAEPKPAHAAPATTAPSGSLLPVAKKRPDAVQLAACNPCNPCAAKNPCNPCAAKNTCNPCAAGGSHSSECVVPRLQQAAAKNPCSPCAAKNPCNPCAAKNPCNPCAAKNPCNPCGAVNPCGPCGAGEVAEITGDEAAAVYACLQDSLAKSYAKAGVAEVAGYQSWANIAKHPYQSATHGSRYVNNYADATGAPAYKKFEQAGEMPKGAVLAKDSFVVHTNGKVQAGPLFAMEKMADGWNEATRDWRYTIIQPDGSVGGVTGGKGMDMQFCADCHNSVAPDLDSIMLLPEDARRRF